ncbi:fatty acyl-AMP ligase [Saccharothrix variisporea]|uniref:Acyl-CoA synthetase (AMP-forming)/AMP-acid ligase II n=1 Tax=Saccharothrix variisporea TaxID=543527 RepID=A0A495X1A4_9PSEU|nr:fatty acyl-AMP ligase [Saccharothrix variisporea]RKT67742.1 acyl-CoA synthetase (AMP-forming)/AMP-acid ligase II [Saccharothrix variisporea]
MLPVVDVKTVVELLRHQARRIPDRRSHVFLDGGGEEAAALTFGELDRRARAVAAELGDLVPPGSCAVLSYPPGLDFLPAFFGCLYAGVVAVPAPATRRTHGDARLERLAAIIADARPDCVLSTSHHLAGRYLADRALATDLVDPAAANRWTPVPMTPDTTAYLQYTSGTTKAPKGVVLTHDNVLGNLSLINRTGEHGDAPTVTWLPLFHDMGLIGGVLRPLHLGHTSVLMAPHVFARSPVTWLRALDRYRAEVAAAPSLGYDLCVRRVTEAQRDGLDLSRLRIAVISDEPLREATIDAFARRFAPSGFRRDAFLPSYGLAESTVLVSGGPLDGEPVVTAFDTDALARGLVRTAGPGARARRLVACGAPDPSLTVVVTDPDGRPTDDVGEIRVSGPSVGLGYWRRPVESRATFESTVDGYPGRRFLRTGNLGFLHDGLLHVLCRTEDLITVDGRAHLPYDLEEAVVAADPAIRAACAFTDPEGRVVVLAETREDVSVTVPGVDLVVPVRPGTLRHTTSGKLRRADSRAAWLSAREERTGR